METTIQPISISKRTAIVDMLRGWALLGVVIMNYIDYYYLGRDFKKYHPDTLTTVLDNFCAIFFSAKSWTLLSLLFGYGFAVLISNVMQKGHHPVKFFAGRMFWLLVLALINSAFWFGDILKDYAFMGLIMLFFYKFSARQAFMASLIIIVLVPFIEALVTHLPDWSGNHFEKLLPLYYSSNLLNQFKFNLSGTYYEEMIGRQYAFTVHFVMLACFFLGYAAQKIDFFNRLVDDHRLIKKIFWYSLLATIILRVIMFFYFRLKWTYNDYYNPRFLTIVSSMLFIASALCWLFYCGKLKPFFKAIESIGRMTLTNYMVQNILSSFIFSGTGLALYNHEPFYFYVLLAITVYVLQIFFSRWWLTKFNYGPVEWVWRQLSYGKRLPIRRQHDNLLAT